MKDVMNKFQYLNANEEKVTKLKLKNNYSFKRIYNYLYKKYTFIGESVLMNHILRCAKEINHIPRNKHNLRLLQAARKTDNTISFKINKASQTSKVYS